MCQNVHIGQAVEHDLCTTCYERPPVLSDRFSWAEGVVAQDRFYCIDNRLCCSVAVRELREASGGAERPYNQAGRRFKASVLGGCLRGA